MRASSNLDRMIEAGHQFRHGAAGRAQGATAGNDPLREAFSFTLL
jgi:hypothetical protein